MNRPPPPADFDDNPPLDDEFWLRAKPTRENLERVLRDVIEAHKAGRSDNLRKAVEAAQELLETAD